MPNAIEAPLSDVARKQRASDLVARLSQNSVVSTVVPAAVGSIPGAGLADRVRFHDSESEKTKFLIA